MGTKGECWMRWCRMKSPKGGRGRGWRTVRAKFLAIQKETERFYPVSDPYLIRNASHDSSDLFPPFLGIILYIDPGQSHSGRRAALRRVASRRISITSPLFFLGRNSGQRLPGSPTHRLCSAFPASPQAFSKVPVLSNS